MGSRVAIDAGGSATTRRRMLASLCLLAVLAWQGPKADAQSPAVTVDDDGTVHVPAQAIPITSFLSPEGRAYLTEHLKLPEHPEMFEERDGVPRFMEAYLARAKVLYPVETEVTSIAGVPSYVYKPKAGIADRNRNRVLIELHGGGFSGCATACRELESLPIAALGRIRVIGVDYRQGPEHRFPAASEDVAAVYSELLKTYPAENIGIYGCSAGGILTGMALAWFQRQGLPPPGAVGILCSGLNVPGEPFIGDGDYMAVPLGEARVGIFPPSTTGYFEGTDPNDPLISPVRSPGVLAQFPPSIVVTGTRAMELSSAVYAHSQLIRNGAVSELHVWEGMIHGFFYNTDFPEAREYFDVMLEFFDRRLGSD